MHGEDRMHRLLTESAEPLVEDDGPIVFENHAELHDYVLRAVAGMSEAEGDKDWIQKAVKRPGRCKDMGSADCPKGSPQYNLAKRFKPGGDLYRGKKQEWGDDPGEDWPENRPKRCPNGYEKDHRGKCMRKAHQYPGASTRYDY